MIDYFCLFRIIFYSLKGVKVAAANFILRLVTVATDWEQSARETGRRQVDRQRSMFITLTTDLS